MSVFLNIDPFIHTIKGRKLQLLEYPYKSNQIVLIRRHSIRQNVPNKDTLVSPDHKIFTDGELGSALNAEFLINKYMNINNTKTKINKVYNIYIKNRHTTMIVNNMIVETMNPRHI